MLGTGRLSVIEDTVIIDRLDVELVSNVQLSVKAKSDFPGAIAAQVTKTYQMHSYLQVFGIFLRQWSGHEFDTCMFSFTKHHVIHMCPYKLVMKPGTNQGEGVSE